MNLKQTISFILLALMAFSLNAEKKRPNIVLIIADDLGFADVSAYPNSAKDISTPNIDRIAEKGMTFTQAYATSPVCSTSRLGLLTGMYQQRWGNYYYGVKLFEETKTFADYLKADGYANGYVGKTHIDKGKKNPLDFGYDMYYGFNGGTQHFFLHNKEAAKHFEGGNLKAGPMHYNRGEIEIDGYSTTLFQNKALEFLDQQKDSDKPFMLTLSFSAVHLFIQIPEKDLKEKGLKPFDMWDPVKEPGRKGYMAWYKRTFPSDDPDGRARYKVCLDYMDKAIGKVLDKLQEQNIEKETLVIFTSDNGGSPRTHADNGKLRDFKYNLYEGGIRVPFIVSHPGVIQENKFSDALISSLDVLPTLLSAADSKLPEGIDGVNLLPALTGQEDFQERILYWGRGSSVRNAVRKGDYKLCIKKDSSELYNLKDDISESKNILNQNPEKAEELKKLFDKWEDYIKNNGKIEGTLKQ